MNKKIIPHFILIAMLAVQITALGGLKELTPANSSVSSKCETSLAGSKASWLKRFFRFNPALFNPAVIEFVRVEDLPKSILTKKTIQPILEQKQSDLSLFSVEKELKGLTEEEQKLIIHAYSVDSYGQKVIMEIITLDNKNLRGNFFNIEGNYFFGISNNNAKVTDIVNLDWKLIRGFLLPNFALQSNIARKALDDKTGSIILHNPDYLDSSENKKVESPYRVHLTQTQADVRLSPNTNRIKKEIEKLQVGEFATFDVGIGVSISGILSSVEPPTLLIYTKVENKNEYTIRRFEFDSNKISGVARGIHWSLQTMPLELGDIFYKEDSPEAFEFMDIDSYGTLVCENEDTEDLKIFRKQDLLNISLLKPSTYREEIEIKNKRRIKAQKEVPHVHVQRMFDFEDDEI